MTYITDDFARLAGARRIHLMDPMRIVPVSGSERYSLCGLWLQPGSVPRTGGLGVECKSCLRAAKNRHDSGE